MPLSDAEKNAIVEQFDEPRLNNFVDLIVDDSVEAFIEGLTLIAERLPAVPTTVTNAATGKSYSPREVTERDDVAEARRLRERELARKGVDATADAATRANQAVSARDFRAWLDAKKELQQVQFEYGPTGGNQA